MNEIDTVTKIFDGITNIRIKSRDEYKKQYRQSISEIELELATKIKSINRQILGRGSETDTFKRLCREVAFLEGIQQILINKKVIKS